MSGAVLGVSVALGALWTARALSLWAAARALPPLPREAGGGARPRVSVVVAARDEAARLETSIRRLREQRDVDLEIVAVDDRSTDGTGEILDRLAEEEPRLQVEHVRRLPDGWLGKCHACHVGSLRATGDWVLFTDADVWLAPDVVARAVAAGEREGAQHVTLLPGQRHLTHPLGAAVIIAMSTGLAPQAARANRGRGSIGIGAFNLVRREALAGVGGYEALRLEVVDDLNLGFLFRAAGYRTRAHPVGHDVDVDFATSPRGLARVLEKNAFAYYGYSALLAFGTIVFLVAALLGSFLLAFVAVERGYLPAFLPVAGLLLQSIPAARLARSAGLPAWPASLLSVGLALLAAAVLRSTVVTLWRGGIRWRDTFYDLGTLRSARRDLRAHAARLRAEARRGG